MFPLSILILLVLLFSSTRASQICGFPSCVGARDVPEPPENAPCRAWHGYWIYCNGHCEELDNSPVWDDSEVKSTPLPCPSLTLEQLDLVLQHLGLMAAVGPAIESYRLEQARERAERAQPKARRFVCQVDSIFLRLSFGSLCCSLWYRLW